MRNPFRRSQPAPTDSLRSVMRVLGLGSLRPRIAAFTVLSLVGGLSQAVLLVLVSEVAVAELQNKNSVRALGHSFSPSSAITVSFVALVLFLSTSIYGAYLSTSVSAEALTATRTRITTGFFRSAWALQSTERLGHIQQLLTVNSVATANAVGNLSRDRQGCLQHLIGVIRRGSDRDGDVPAVDDVVDHVEGDGRGGGERTAVADLRKPEGLRKDAGTGEGVEDIGRSLGVGIRRAVAQGLGRPDGKLVDVAPRGCCEPSVLRRHVGKEVGKIPALAGRWQSEICSGHLIDDLNAAPDSLSVQGNEHVRLRRVPSSSTHVQIIRALTLSPCRLT